MGANTNIDRGSRSDARAHNVMLSWIHVEVVEVLEGMKGNRRRLGLVGTVRVNGWLEGGG